MDIAVLASGGVDSSVALALLHEQGHRLSAFYLKIWLEKETAFLGACPFDEDLSFVRAVCDRFGVPLEVVPLQREYYERVVSYTLAELRAGRTPSPDVLCNRHIKFGEFVAQRGAGFDFVASGHYARTRSESGLAQLLSCPDPVKDQTYFLAQMTQSQLSRALFPVGGCTKAEVRSLAARFDLPNKDRRDSQGICFLGKIKFRDFVLFHLGRRPGPIVEVSSGRTLGRHEGYWFYTLGQRQGLGLSGGPWYVVGKDIERNAVIVSAQEDSAHRDTKEFSVCDFNWISGSAPEKLRLEVKIRHGARRYGCDLAFSPDRTCARVRLDQPDPGVAAGQFAVFYDGEVCLGSGVIG